MGESQPSLALHLGVVASCGKRLSGLRAPGSTPQPAMYRGSIRNPLGDSLWLSGNASSSNGAEPGWHPGEASTLRACAGCPREGGSEGMREGSHLHPAWAASQGLQPPENPRGDPLQGPAHTHHPRRGLPRPLPGSPGSAHRSPGHGRWSCPRLPARCHVPAA